MEQNKLPPFSCFSKKSINQNLSPSIVTNSIIHKHKPEDIVSHPNNEITKDISDLKLHQQIPQKNPFKIYFQGFSNQIQNILQPTSMTKKPYDYTYQEESEAKLLLPGNPSTVIDNSLKPNEWVKRPTNSKKFLTQHRGVSKNVPFQATKSSKNLKKNEDKIQLINKNKPEIIKTFLENNKKSTITEKEISMKHSLPVYQSSLLQLHNNIQDNLKHDILKNENEIEKPDVNTPFVNNSNSFVFQRVYKKCDDIKLLSSLASKKMNYKKQINLDKEIDTLQQENGSEFIEKTSETNKKSTCTRNETLVLPQKLPPPLMHEKQLLHLKSDISKDENEMFKLAANKPILDNSNLEQSTSSKSAVPQNSSKTNKKLTGKKKQKNPSISLPSIHIRKTEPMNVKNNVIEDNELLQLNNNKSNDDEFACHSILVDKLIKATTITPVMAVDKSTSANDTSSKLNKLNMSNTKKFKHSCHYCGIKFKTSLTLSNHILISHIYNEPLTNDIIVHQKSSMHNLEQKSKRQHVQNESLLCNDQFNKNISTENLSLNTTLYQSDYMQTHNNNTHDIENNQNNDAFQMLNNQTDLEVIDFTNFNQSNEVQAVKAHCKNTKFTVSSLQKTIKNIPANNCTMSNQSNVMLTVQDLNDKTPSTKNNFTSSNQLDDVQVQDNQTFVNNLNKAFEEVQISWNQTYPNENNFATFNQKHNNQTVQIYNDKTYSTELNKSTNVQTLCKKTSYSVPHQQDIVPTVQTFKNKDPPSINYEMPVEPDLVQVDKRCTDEIHSSKNNCSTFNQILDSKAQLAFDSCTSKLNHTVQTVGNKLEVIEDNRAVLDESNKVQSDKTQFASNVHNVADDPNQTNTLLTSDMIQVEEKTQVPAKELIIPSQLNQAILKTDDYNTQIPINERPTFHSTDKDKKKVIMFHCHLCNASFLFDDLLDKHLICMHKTLTTPIACHLCDDTFSTRYMFQEHMNEKHLLMRFDHEHFQWVKQSTGDFKFEFHERYKSPKLMTCSECNISFSSTTYHNHFCLDAINYQCDICHFNFGKKKTFLIKHYQTHMYKNKYICDNTFCSTLKFSNKEDLLKHIAEVH